MNALEELIMPMLGSSPDPMPSRRHLQGELFMLAKANPRLAPLIGFERRCNGPYSARLQDASLEPFHRAGAYGVDRAGRMHLTEEGGRILDEKVADAGPQSKLADLLIVAELIRRLYDRMSVDELLFLIYKTSLKRQGTPTCAAPLGTPWSAAAAAAAAWQTRCRKRARSCRIAALS